MKLNPKDLGFIRDPALKERLMEDLEDHLEDLKAEGKDTAEPWKLLGDPEVIRTQMNSIGQPWGKHVAFCVFGGFAIFMILNVLVFDVDAATPQAWLAQALGAGIGIVFWGLFLFLLIFSLLRWFITQLGFSSRGQLLTYATLGIPYVFFIIEKIGRVVSLFYANAMDHGNLIDPWGELFLTTLGLGFAFWIASLARRMAFRYAQTDQKFYERLMNLLPWLVAGTVILGVHVTQLSFMEEEWAVALLSFPLIFTMLLYLIIWGGGTALLSLLFIKLSVSVIYSFVTVVNFALLCLLSIGVRRLFKKPWAYSEKIIAAIFIPLAVFIPFMEQDIPHVQWKVPLVWSWEALEAQQLSFTFPWTAPLMRSNDSPNVSYRAEKTEEGLLVYQTQGTVLKLTREATTQEASVNDFKFRDGAEFTEEGFHCNRDETDLTDQPVDFFGLSCDRLFYKDQLIAVIDKRNLVDLDLTTDGLLAITLNMGSYDPDYVYVVDVSEMK